MFFLNLQLLGKYTLQFINNGAIISQNSSKIIPHREPSRTNRVRSSVSSFYKAINCSLEVLMLKK